MFKLLADNPLALIAALGVVDVFGLIGFILFTIKNTPKGDRLKKILIVSVCFIAIDAVITSFLLTKNTYYDRNGDRYSKAEEVCYYDADGTSYRLFTDEKQRSHLISGDGRQMFTADRVYIDKDGYIVYDRTNSFKEEDNHKMFTDSDGNEYFSIYRIKWDKNGKIVPNEKK
ncbi:MAG: hypothetical protein MJ168_07415 [Clostridia bacterium]|nr:hypothetical protein [Clostridia bacterium]